MRSMASSRNHELLSGQLRTHGRGGRAARVLVALMLSGGVMVAQSAPMVAPGQGHTLLLLGGGIVYAWADNFHGQLCIGSNTTG